jgi:hypothetical protein
MTVLAHWLVAVLVGALMWLVIALVIIEVAR